MGERRTEKGGAKIDKQNAEVVGTEESFFPVGSIWINGALQCKQTGPTANDYKCRPKSKPDAPYTDLFD
jgi:hypothetical protein